MLTSSASAATPADAAPPALPSVAESAPLHWQGWCAVLALAATFTAAAIWALDFGRPWAPRGEAWMALQARHGQPDTARPALQILAGRAARADVILWGDSAVREGYIDDADIERALVARGRALRVVNLGSSAQQMTDALFLLSLMPVRAGQLHVLHLRFSMLRRDPRARIDAGTYLALPADGADEPVALPEGGLARLALRWRSARDLLQRRAVEPVREAVRERLYRRLPVGAVTHDPATVDRVADEAHVDALVHTARSEIDTSFDAHLPLFARALEAFIDRVEGAGGRVVLAAVPRTAEQLALAEPARVDAFERIVEDVRMRHRLDRLDLNAVAAPSPSEVADLTHVNGAGRTRWSTAFADWLVADGPRGLAP